MRLSIRRRAGVAAGALVTLLAAPLAAADPPPAPALPAPFAGWNVVIQPSADPHVEWVDFDSAALHRRVSMRVVLPDAYLTTDRVLPVVYYLHGTIRIGTDPAVDRLADQLAADGVDLGYPFGPGSARNEAAFLAQEAGRIGFVVVSPDAEAGDPWCEHCAWVDGRSGRGVAAETHLYDEVLPLTEALFRVRTDRAGRGVMGASMGAGGALTQAVRHPDRFAVVAALSPPIDYIHDTPYADFLWFLYLREQGYPLPATDPVPTQAVNAADLLDNLRGEGIDTVITIGDGCVLGAGHDTCQEVAATDEPIDAFQEIFIRHNLDRVVPPAVAAGVPISYITYDGVHFVVNHEIFDRYLLDRMNADFAVGTPTPASFTYRAADDRFTIWGWHVGTQRAAPAFVTLAARTDGREATVTADGVVTLTTPAAFIPGSTHTVAVTSTGAAGGGWTTTVVAGPDGRLTLPLDLRPAPALALARGLGVAIGASPQARVVVLD